MTTIIGAFGSIAAMLIGNHLLGKWLGALRFWIAEQKDPILIASMKAEYARLDADARSTMKKDGPL